MGSFGTSSSEQESTASSGINKQFLPFAKNALIRAGQVGDQGYVPFMGNDVAVPDSLVNSWQQTADRSAAFNGTPQQDIRSQMPLQTQNGVQGLSSFSGYQDQLAQLQKTYPGLYDYIKSFSIDPITGKLGSRAFGNMSLDSGKKPGGNGSGNGAMPGAASNGDAAQNWYYTRNRDSISLPDLINNTYGTRAYNG
jgi:hypothetical protein